MTFLEQQVQRLQSQQQQLATQEASKEKERVLRQEVKKQLAVFLQEGQKIKNGIEYNNPASLEEKAAWERQVGEYLSKNLDESYAVRFRNVRQCSGTRVMSRRGKLIGSSFHENQ